VTAIKGSNKSYSQSTVKPTGNNDEDDDDDDKKKNLNNSYSQSTVKPEANFEIESEGEVAGDDEVSLIVRGHYCQ
jgi:hypothetical protein